MGKRKLLTVIGYGIAAITKPCFPLAGSAGLVFTARFIDRIGKGIRGAPRDALIADIAPSNLRGASYGLRRSLDTVDAFAGPLLAVAFMALLANDIRAVFWVATIPAFIAVAILIFGVKEPESRPAEGLTRSAIQLSIVQRVDAAYWWIVLIAAVLTLARFSEAFLVLRALNVGLAIKFVPLVMVVVNVVYALSSYPAGALSDRMDRLGVMAIGCAALIIADIVLSLASDVWGVMVGVVFWGLHIVLTQGLLAAMVASTSPPDQRGTALGIFHLISGFAILFASLTAGLLWDQYEPGATFLGGAGFTIIALISLLITGRLHRAPP